jgi:dTMP kinase
MSADNSNMAMGGGGEMTLDEARAAMGAAVLRRDAKKIAELKAVIARLAPTGGAPKGKGKSTAERRAEEEARKRAEEEAVLAAKAEEGAVIRERLAQIAEEERVAREAKHKSDKEAKEAKKKRKEEHERKMERYWRTHADPYQQMMDERRGYYEDGLAIAKEENLGAQLAVRAAAAQGLRGDDARAFVKQHGSYYGVAVTLNCAYDPVTGL